MLLLVAWTLVTTSLGPPSSMLAARGVRRGLRPQMRTAASPAVASEQRQHPADCCGCCGEPSPVHSSLPHPLLALPPGPQGVCSLGHTLPGMRPHQMAWSSCNAWSQLPVRGAQLIPLPGPAHCPHPLPGCTPQPAHKPISETLSGSQSKVLFTGKPQRPQGRGSQDWVK